MSAAVVASVLRNRKSGQRRVNPTTHKFTWRRFFLIVFLGVILFIPGVVVTIIGIRNADKLDEFSGDASLFKFIGPAGVACGTVMIIAAGIYYCCWGYQSAVSTRHARKHKQAVYQSEQLEPLQNPPVSKILEERDDLSPLTSVRSLKFSQAAKARANSVVGTPPNKSGRGSNGSHPSKKQTSSKSSSNSRNQSCQSSKYRSGSQSQHGNYSNVPRTQNYHHPPSSKSENNQVSVVETTAPLAQEEACIGIAMSTDIDYNIEE